MKIVPLFLLAASASAFSPVTFTKYRTGSSALNLFGSGDKKDGGGAPGGGAGGMLQQVAMLKKAQELASKKAAIDSELKKIDFVGSSADEKVKCIVNYITSSNPQEPQPEFQAKSFEFDDEFFESSSPDAIAEASKEAYELGTQEALKAAEEKFNDLKQDVAEMMSFTTGGAPPPPAEGE
eukprot:CAMPEP_0202458096 /NCGR_PEP_ID=MMETSP1360-20130828/21123_1 /ASSEMBLY_ACC=CAM_ASM_000848 /TAXON_ID=515479 /ORGANISM="Licmophora paradoxa, Strain CCMP2313" /LENGTH=179 /DNA_ID=CAMNT_0049078455 /DNA_START=23 /DNA_END=562 /DNA_ORIENTATION=+